MLKSYLIIAFRNLKKYKVFSFINIAGLSISIAVILLIAVYAQMELSMDKFHSNYSRIIKIGKGNVPAPIADIIKLNLPEIKKTTRVEGVSSNSVTIKYDNKVLTVKKIIYSEPDFFDIFSFKALEGNLKALSDPMTIVLTRTEAKRIFGNTSPIGKVVKMDNRFDLTVQAVIEDIPQNSSMQFSGVISFSSLKMKAGKYMDPYNWFRINYQTYVLFPQNFIKNDIEKKITSLLKNNIPKTTLDLNIDLIPFKDIYYNNEIGGGLHTHGSIAKNIALISIAILILLIAIINYMNLSTARASMRTKEIGVRKTVGASRLSLIYQFLSESIVLSIISMVFAVMIALTLIPVFNELLNTHLLLFPDRIILRCIILTSGAVILGILAGLYPAFYLTSFKPDVILKGVVNQIKGKAFLRKGLIVFQFSVAVVIIASTIVIFNQMNYVKNKPLGFEKENIIYIPVNSEIYLKKDIFQTKILQHSAVEDFAYSHGVPGNMVMSWGTNMKYEGKDYNITYTAVPISSDFMRLMKMKLVEGRGFIDKDTNDYVNVIVNEAFVKKYGMKNPLNAKVIFDRGGKIVGVVKNFNYKTLHSDIEPLAFINDPEDFSHGLIKLKSSKYSDIKDVINHLESTWKEISPDFPFEYNFLDESLSDQYKSEERFEKAFILFSLLAIFIACLGLFGLSTFTTEQRIKEIGIRKILGASTSNITVMLSKQFVVLVLISNLIAWPTAYILMHKWLQDFAYRINISWWIFVLSGGMALIIAMLTISYQAIKAATANPVEALRYE
jgi:ABC-type antimicrobial peptide transport system permease subunit